MVDSPEVTYTVRELAGAVARTVARAFPDELWVRGEIRDLSRSRQGHVYFNLVDPSDDSGALPAVSVPVTLFSSDRDAVNRLLMRAGGAVRMTDGIEIRARGTVSYYPARSTVQLRMTWIDPDYTLGRLAADRDRILRDLAAEGLLGVNATRTLPLVPLRVGLVTSSGSAAYADFVHELELSGYGWRITLADAQVQGVDAVPSIVAALRALAEEPVEVIALVRGGGARTDLAAFDDERVARAIAASPVPVVTGIGHEIDATVADAVAHSAFKTPTAAAAALVALVARHLDRLDHIRTRIGNEVRDRVRRDRRRLDDRAVRLTRTTRSGVRHATTRVDELTGRLSRSSRRVGTMARFRWAAAAHRAAAAGSARLAALDALLRRHVDATRSLPVAVLRRAEAAVREVDGVVAAAAPDRLKAQGWSLVRDRSGAVIRTVAQLAPGAAATVELHDGSARVTVDEVIPVEDKVTGATEEGAASNGRPTEFE